MQRKDFRLKISYLGSSHVRCCVTNEAFKFCYFLIQKRQRLFVEPGLMG